MALRLPYQLTFLNSASYHASQSMKADTILLFHDWFGHDIFCQQKPILNKVVNILLEYLDPSAGVEDLKYVFHLFEALPSLFFLRHHICSTSGIHRF
jgi:hypothetical protein